MPDRLPGASRSREPAPAAGQGARPGRRSGCCSRRRSGPPSAGRLGEAPPPPPCLRPGRRSTAAAPSASRRGRPRSIRRPPARRPRRRRVRPRPGRSTCGGSHCAWLDAGTARTPPPHGGRTARRCRRGRRRRRTSGSRTPRHEEAPSCRDTCGRLRARREGRASTGRGFSGSASDLPGGRAVDEDSTALELQEGQVSNEVRSQAIVVFESRRIRGHRPARTHRACGLHGRGPRAGRPRALGPLGSRSSGPVPLVSRVALRTSPEVGAALDDEPVKLPFRGVGVEVR